MRFARCADCNGYKYLLDDGKCKSCSNIKITNTVEIEKPNIKFESDTKIKYLGQLRIITDIIYSDSRDKEWYYELDMGVDFVSIERGNKDFTEVETGDSL